MNLKFFIGCLAECVVGRPDYFQERRWLQLDLEQKCHLTVKFYSCDNLYLHYTCMALYYIHT